MSDSRYWAITHITGEDDLALPHPNARRGGFGPYIIPIVDEEYGGVIAWANTEDLADKIVAALSLAEASAHPLEES